MTASTKERNKIEEHLPYDLLKRLYLDSRVSIKQLEKDFGISHHTISKYLKESENRYKLYYTLDIDTNLLGFSEARILGVKFERVPDLKLLQSVLSNDPFVQNAYLATGDFDLIMHVVGLNYIEYYRWEYKFRMGFSHYKPRLKVSTLNDMVEGFMPISSKLIPNSKGIDETEKKILIKLIENSRIKLKELSKTTKLSQMKLIYTIKKLKKLGIIRQFTTGIQDPDKRIFLFYSVVNTPNEDHHRKTLPKFLKNIIERGKKNEITTDYSVVCDTSGHFDAVYFCNFKDGTALDERGPNFLKKVWESELPVVEQGILTELITGKWPFNANNYTKWRVELEEIERKPIKFEIYK